MGWNFEDFYISKSYVVSDIDQFISAVMGYEGDINSEAMGMITPSLHHNLDDFESLLLSPYDADAMEMSIRTGQLLDQYARAYHSGPDDPNYELALEEGLRIGRPMINEAAERQNILNRQRGIGPVPLPFDKTGADPARWSVNATHKAENPALVQAQKNKDGTFNPFHTQNGKLVTHIVSAHNGNVEGYARWYEEAAKDLGYVGRRYDRRTGRRDTRNRYIIPAQFVHRNVITINDRNMRDSLGRLVKDLQAQATSQGMNPEQAYAYVKENFMNDNMVYHGTHHGHHNFDSTHGRIGRKAQQAAEIRSGDLMPPDQEEDPSQVLPSSVESKVSEEIIHPELRDKNWIKNLGKGSYRGNKSMVRAIADAHELDEEVVQRIFDDAYAGKIRGRSAKQRKLNGLYDAHMRETGGRPPSWYGGPSVEVPQEEEKSPEPAMRQEEPQVPNMEPPTNIPRQPLPPPPNPSPNATTPPPTGPSYVPPMFRITQGNSDIPMSQSSDVSGQGRGLLSRLAGLLGKMSVDDIILRSDDFRNDFEEYIEEVQLELAKSLIDDTTHLGKLSVDSPIDVALLSSKVQMGTTDVISIFHTRGDWRQIAKAFNIPHENVQMVKVALYD